MAKKPSKLTPLGSATADEIYILVGTALSYWEASEDVMMGLFRWLCADIEPVAYASYVHAPRNVRTSMLELALNTYGHRLNTEEKSSIQVAMSQLNKLASVRNEIAHGHVSNIAMEEQENDDRRTVAKGHYLLPSLNEQGYHLRDFRFHHTAETILDFREKVRDHRWTIFEAQSSAMIREQEEDRIAGFDIWGERRTILDMAMRKIKAADYARYLRPTSEWSRS